MGIEDFASMRTDYRGAALDEAAAEAGPVALFALWIAEAEAAGEPEPNAMTLATATPDGAPSARLVLAKSIDSDGIVFFTHGHSRKGVELAANPRAAAVFWWPMAHRQVRVEGAVVRIGDAASDAYFAARPRGAQIGAVASHQSDPIADRLTLEAQFAAAAEAAGDDEVARPDGWGGFRIAWEAAEFWQGRANRLHDRLRFTRDGDAWQVQRLQP